MAWFLHFLQQLAKPENEEASTSTKHLAGGSKKKLNASTKQSSKGSKKKPNILQDFNACTYVYEDETTSEHTFINMRTKVSK